MTAYGNSTISLISFIFGISDSYLKKDSYKLSNLLQILENFGKTETSIRTSLSRMCKTGILINKRHESEVYYSFTESGKRDFNNINIEREKLYKRYYNRSNGWDNMFFTVNLSFVEDKVNVEKLIEELKMLGMKKVTKKLWISFYDMEKEVLELATKFGIKQNVLIFKGKSNLLENDLLFKKIFEVKKMEKIYAQFEKKNATAIKNVLTTIQGKNQEEQIKEFPEIKRIVGDFFNVSIYDPMFPKEINKENYVCDKIEIFLKLREGMIEVILDYLKKFE